jgi:hypothetical protein
MLGSNLTLGLDYTTSNITATTTYIKATTPNITISLIYTVNGREGGGWGWVDAFSGEAVPAEWLPT